MLRTGSSIIVLDVLSLVEVIAVYAIYFTLTFVSNNMESESPQLQYEYDLYISGYQKFIHSLYVPRALPSF